ISAVDSAVQPLRSKITCTTAAIKGTTVMTSTAYQLRDPTRGVNVTTIALTSAADVTMQRTAMVLSDVCDSAWAAQINAYAKPMPTCRKRKRAGRVKLTIAKTARIPSPEIGADAGSTQEINVA